MVIGVDVVNMGANSVVGMTASYNQSLTQFFNEVTLQDLHKGKKDISKREQEELICQERQEILAGFVKRAIEAYQKQNKGQKPQLIAFYRDGVGGPTSEEFVIQNEGPSGPLQNAIRSIADGYNPKILYTLVYKRISTRLLEEFDASAVVNPGKGTMVDKSIVDSNDVASTDVNKNFDFYMIANDNPKTATALPVHYKIIMNSSGMNKREIEEFTYQQCYQYFGFGGPIKVPAAVKYAEKLAQYAFDTKSSNRKEDFRPPNPHLNYQLHFL